MAYRLCEKRGGMVTYLDSRTWVSRLAFSGWRNQVIHVVKMNKSKILTNFKDLAVFAGCLVSI